MTYYRKYLPLLLLALLLGPFTTHAATDCNAVTEISPMECESLLQLYNSTDGTNWTNNEGWNVTNTPCSWYGVICENGGVRRLYFGSNQLTGNIPDFSGLPNLQTLSLVNNQLTGVIPEFSGLPNLQELSLERNQLTGNIPDFSGLPNLQRLSLSNNRLTGAIPNFNGLLNLRRLYLDNNQLTSSIPDLGTLTELEYLDLRNNSVCKNSNINYSVWPIKQDNFTDETTWQVQLNGFSDCPTPPTDCNAVTEISPIECESLLQLYHNTDGSNWFNNDGWNVTNTPCSWYGVICENTCKDFNTYFICENNGVTGVTEIGLSVNNLQGTLPDFSGLSNLLVLSLDRNQLTGTLPDFSELPNLQGFYLGGNQLTGTIPDFSNLPNLRTLYLYGNQLTGEIPDFSNLSNLQEFHIYGNQLTGIIPNFSGLPNLQKLSLQGNQLTGAIPDFSTLTGLEYLDLRNNSICKNTKLNYSTWAIKQADINDGTTWQAQLNGFSDCLLPFAQLTATPLQGTVSLTVNLDGSASTAPNSTITYYSWWASDGRNMVTEMPTATMTFVQPGTYTIYLGVGDNIGAASTNTAQRTVTVKARQKNKIPIAQLTATPLQGLAPLTVNLDGSASTDTDGTIAYYSWWASDGQNFVTEIPTATMTFPQPGTYNIYLGVGDDYGTPSTNTEQKTVIVDEPGKNNKIAAILIHPRGQGTGYKQEVSIQWIATYAYRTLKNRDYKNEDIYFISHKSDLDIDGDGLPDSDIVDGPVTISDLEAGIEHRDLNRHDIQQAFAWATIKGQLDQPLLVIFIDHGLTGKLRLDPFNEVLTAQDLGSMLNDYQNATNNQVMVIIEACYSGSLIKELAAPNRFIVTSAAEDQAYYDNLGMLSFSKFYFDYLRRNYNFFEAFDEVKGKLRSYGYPFNLQTPQLDDDGDGQSNTSYDGQMARKLYLNGSYGALSGEISLEPKTPPSIVTAGQTITFSVRAGITEGRIKKVWALIMTPDATKKQRNEQGFSLIPTPIVNLNQNSGDETIWEGTFSDFHYRGDYVVTFMAEDNTGFITTASPIILNLPEGREVPEIPIIAQTVYRNDERFRMTLPPLPVGQVQYVGVALPNSTIFVLTGLNGFIPFDGVTLPVWQDGEIAIEVPVSADWPRGEYTLYLLRMPVGVEPLANQEQWILGTSQFKLEN